MLLVLVPLCKPLNVAHIFRARSPNIPFPQTSLTLFREHSKSLGGVNGSYLSESDLTTQVMAVEGCLSAGTPLNALGNPLFRGFLHHVGAKLPGANHLSNRIPFIEKKEVSTF